MMQQQQSSMITKRSVGQQCLLSAMAVVSVAATCFTFSSLIDYKVVALILLLTVSLIAITSNIYPVLLAAVLSALIWDFFFIPPRFTVHIASTEDSILLAMYFVIALINGVLTYKIRGAEKVARLKEERANSVKLYNTILNSLSHELRTPLAAIIGASDNLRFNANLTKDDKSLLLGEISKAALRLNQQVENLLNISRLESGHIQPKKDWCDVVEVIYEVVRQVEDNNSNRTVEISTRQDLPLCRIDKGMLEQILYNLLNNAAIHTPIDTRITITASCHADVLEIIIEDDGKGFLAMDKQDVLHKFSREKENKNSRSGLGLSIVKGFSEALGGTVTLNNSAKGASFILNFPVATTTLLSNYEQS